jgi:hypothetical protein
MRIKEICEFVPEYVEMRPPFERVDNYDAQHQISYYDTCKRYCDNPDILLQDEFIIICYASSGNTVYIDKNFSGIFVGQHIFRVRRKYSATILNKWIYQIIYALVDGTRMTRTQVKNLDIGVAPSLVVQKRIIARCEQCDFNIRQWRSQLVECQAQLSKYFAPIPLFTYEYMRFSDMFSIVSINPQSPITNCEAIIIRWGTLGLHVRNVITYHSSVKSQREYLRKYKYRCKYLVPKTPSVNLKYFGIFMAHTATDLYEKIRTFSIKNLTVKYRCCRHHLDLQIFAVPPIWVQKRFGNLAEIECQLIKKYNFKFANVKRYF